MLTIALSVVQTAKTAKADDNSATSVTSQQHLILLKKFYHADGYIKAIGHVAFRTIYSSNPKTRNTWKRALHYLENQRHSAYVSLHPQTRSLRGTTVGLPPHYSAWLCIHHYEGSWTDSGDPYWGGLQFGWNEWQTYGSKYAHTANLATPLEQMWAAEAYYNTGAGFNPWPNTARMCGLL